MSQSTNPAWQGAIKVAQARLLTIDEALAKLEAAVPNVKSSPQPKPKPQTPEGTA